METWMIKAAQLIVALAFLVIVHEFGHYVFARIFGIRVNRFYMFFNPYFSLLKYYPAANKLQLIAWTDKVYRGEGKNKELVEEKPRALLTIPLGKPKKDVNSKGKPNWRATLYGIGWVPLGGYCDIAGMVDETKGADTLAKEPQSWEFRTKPAWQRLLVMLGGVIFNFILAIIIYAGIAFYWGEKYVEYKDITAGMVYSATPHAAGFQDGDIPLLADGDTLRADDSSSNRKLLTAKVVTVLRDGKPVDIHLPENFPVTIDKGEFFMSPLVPIVVNDIQGGGPAAKAGIQAGDSIVAVGGVRPIYQAMVELDPADYPRPDSTRVLAVAATAFKEKPTAVTVVRDGKEMELTVTPDGNGKLGILLKPFTDIYPVKVKEYGLLESVPVGVTNGTKMLVNYVSQFKYVFTKDGAKSIGGFGAIGDMFPDSWNWLRFWEITAFLSVALAFMNIIPIPALDGGHVLFLLVEMIIRRRPSEKFLEYANMAGMCFLLLLLLYANGMDIVRAILN